ncbi:sucrase ferredoxin [Corynebacterium sp. TAE3-ERU12]|uniref:sucrase ferredoxin n=1 Tax=Corynebacterium sp. TAE3-ERU12 TaxID=2849491 RepID=UPI001C43E60E|nr:sucrase ferredoxin [Corynebacterium sp. TAE3-ERU12]MBV7294737.1 sucrase ferredoxin [Corynebacterium sp. TAE3-ERU12]
MNDCTDPAESACAPQPTPGQRRGVNTAEECSTASDSCDTPTRRPARAKAKSARPRPEGCSDRDAEPLAGTAKSATLFIALEYRAGWSRDILDGGVFGEAESKEISRWLKERGAQLQLIRRPGRAGQRRGDDDDGQRVVFISHCSPNQPGGAWMETRTVSGIAELMSLDIRHGKPTAGAHITGEPLLLVCTHGKRDKCCALKGRPVAAELHSKHGDRVWETSHSKGHRFAPTMLLMPWNYSYGRISIAETDAVVHAAANERLEFTGCRGRGTWKPRGQVAELAARRFIGSRGLDDVIEVTDTDTAVVVRFRSGKRCAVQLEQIVTDAVISSCGDNPKPQKGWVATEVTVLPPR